MRWNQIILALAWYVAADVAVAGSPEGWKPVAARPPLLPTFSSQGKGDQLELSIEANHREAIDGAWVRTFPIQGGKHYRFSAQRFTTNVASPRRSALVRVIWQDDDGKLVHFGNDRARPEYPRDQGPTKSGGTLVADTYAVPSGATQARIELRLRWTTGAVRWSQVQLVETDPPGQRLVRLATVHFRPRQGQTNDAKCRSFAPWIAQAASEKADVVCLPESLTYCDSGRSIPDCAEPIPGPSTDYFGSLAKQHNLYIVAGLSEQDGDVVYNTAALLGPNGQLVGKYRKVCLPREEIEAGVTPGKEYPVFDTRFGKLGMMICWDVMFPEVARRLAANGAEVIAMPIWGGNPTLASARAIENQIFLVSSTYTDHGRQEMVSGVWDRRGQLLVRNGAKWGDVLVTEVDLNQRQYWNWLGDLRARIPRERPSERGTALQPQTGDGNPRAGQGQIGR